MNIKAVTRDDAINFLEGACRNWSHVPALSEDDIGDVATELLRFVAKRDATLKRERDAALEACNTDPQNPWRWWRAKARELADKNATLKREIATLREATLEEAAQVIEEGFDKAVGESYRNDGKPSKNDKCPHGRYHYEDCDQCCADAVRALSGREVTWGA